MHEDATRAADALHAAIQKNPRSPAWANAYAEARRFYLPTECLRFSGGPIDDDDGPQARINGWPADESALLEIIQRTEPHQITSDTLEARTASPGSEPATEPVLSGFHALHTLGHLKPSPRQQACLLAAASLLARDLRQQFQEWNDGALGNYRAIFTSKPDLALLKIFTGLAILSQSELSATRIQFWADTGEPAALPAEITSSTKGMLSFWNGNYTRRNGAILSGPGLRELVGTVDPELAGQLDRQFQISIDLANTNPLKPKELISSLETQADLLRSGARKLGIAVPFTPLGDDDDAPPVGIPQPESLSGGATTNFALGAEAFGSPLANATNLTRRDFIVGNMFFTQEWLADQGQPISRRGLGPHFQARSCFECHPSDGRSPLSLLLLRASVAGETSSHGGPAPHPNYGTQLSERAIPNSKPRIEKHLTWSESSGSFPDGEIYRLRRPDIKVTKWNYGEPTTQLAISPRLGQPIFGLGLLEAIPEADLQPTNGGRTNRVWDPSRKAPGVGRFGWKANVATLNHQTILALENDLGIDTSGTHPEINSGSFDRLVTYVRALAPPARRDTQSPAVLRGETIFRHIRCAACHRETFTTGKSPFMDELSNQVIHPYSDLLLHDMGPGLADNRPDFAATGSEWRTAPLWGIGLNESVNGNAHFLHDGRARNFTEAILWHGGEASDSVTHFKALNGAQRQDLMRFLASL